MSSLRRRIRLATTIASISACLISVGCGKGTDFPTAKVAGKVTLDGKPVDGGTITLSPMSTGKPGNAGKAAAGDIKSDGTFQLTTYQPNDGAVLGKHRVTFSAPAVAAPAAPEGAHVAPPKSPYDGATPKTTEIEVKSGDNNLNIELEIRPAG